MLNAKSKLKCKWIDKVFNIIQITNIGIQLLKANLSLCLINAEPVNK